MAYYSRLDWGAKPPKNSPTVVPMASRREFIVHYSTGEELGREDCKAWVREIQAFHQGPQRGWADIGYNFLVCKHGDVFEGRGWTVVGAHCPNHNTVAIGVCFLGDDDPGQDAPDKARVAIRALWKQAEAKADHPLTTHGHREFKSTSCPGDELHAWVKSGLPVAFVPPPAPPVDPSQGDDDMGVAQRMVLRPNGSGYILDHRGGIHPIAPAGVAKPPAVKDGPYWSEAEFPTLTPAVDLVILDWDKPSGYVLDEKGGKHAFGGAPALPREPYWE